MKYPLFILCILLAKISLSNPVDTTIFNSDFEKEVILKYYKTVPVSSLDLFICLNYNEKTEVMIKTEINGLISKLEEKGIAKKSKKRQIKLIYKFIHETCLTKYNDQTFFDDIFKTGEYNCLTASALYGIILEYFNIDFVVKETPNHVYLIADPKDTHIEIETTLPYNGIMVYDIKFKSEFVEYLVSNKLISQEEYDSKTIDELFDKNFDPNNDIDLYQLAGLHYYNKGISHYNASNYKKATASFQKAKLIYPSNMVNYMLNASFGDLIWSQANNKTYSGESLAKYLNLNYKNMELSTSINDHFKFISNELIINHPNIGFYKQFYNDFKLNIDDSIDIEDYKQTYYSYSGYHNYANNRHYAALQNLYHAYLSNPDHLWTKELIHNAGIKYMLTDSRHEANIDSLEKYFDIFPFLIEDINFQKYYTYCYLRSIYQYFEAGMEVKGADLIFRLDIVLEENPNISFQDDAVEGAFSMIAEYYISKGQTSKGIQYINKGLQIIPHSIMLTKLKSSISNYQKHLKTIEDRIASMPKKESYREQFTKRFIKSWHATKVIEANEEKSLNANEKIIIKVLDKKKVEYSINGVAYKGKWDLRPKSKHLYLIPEKNEKEYLVYKIVEIADDILILKAYNGDKRSSRKIFMKIQ